MQYIRGARDLTLTIKPSEDPKWWVDSLYTVHQDTWSHTGVVMSLGRGATYTASTKQKLNTKSSTEAEFVALDDTMAQVLWTIHFLAEWGEYLPTTTICQDNKSTIILAENGTHSSSQHTRHMNLRYFFIIDKIKKGEVKGAFCSTHDILADFFIKPLQGTLFTRMQDKMLNLPCITSPTVHRSVLEIKKYGTKIIERKF